MFAGVSSNILSDTSINPQAGDKVAINARDTITADSLNMDSVNTELPREGRTVLDTDKKLHVSILSGGIEDTISQVLIQWCVYNKYLYKVFYTLPDTTEMTEYEVVLFGDYEITSSDTNTLYSYAEMGKTMIFTRLPDYRLLSSNRRLAAFYGIKNSVSETVTADGIKIFPDFMINKERIYRNGDYFGELDDTEVNIPYYSLAAGYEVYSVGILKNQQELAIKDKDLPPLLWRTTIGKSFVCAVNSNIFDGMTMLGVLTGFMAHQGDYYVYPVVNAQTISLISYPYFSNENQETMQQLYSRNSEGVARDLLWPNVVQILKNYGGSYSFFSASQLDYLDEVGPQNDYIDFYLREIGKLPGNMGLSLGQVSESDRKAIMAENEEFYKNNLPDYIFTALYLADFNKEELKESLESDFYRNISLVMSDYAEGDSVLEFLEENVLSVKFNLEGYEHETMDDLRMSSIENVLGMCNMKVDMARVFYPQDSTDEWNNLSLKWSKGNTYFKDYTTFDMVTIGEMENRVRRFLALDYTLEYNPDDISIQIDHFDKEAYFIVRTNNRHIDYVENGTAMEISGTAYLIKAEAADVTIHMIEENVLKKPRNNKTIPSNPQ
ncbi:MAG: putative rane protein [Anaerocolumna sp.]|nr:putative rane protein [Anaerocolumna sp.]